MQLHTPQVENANIQSAFFAVFVHLCATNNKIKNIRDLYGGINDFNAYPANVENMVNS